jgi:hypothetical protein
VDCDGAFILFTTDNDKIKLNIHFDTSHQRHCIENYFSDDIDAKQETFSTKEREKNTIAIVSLEDFKRAFGEYCKALAEWLAKRYKEAESQNITFKPKEFLDDKTYYDNAGLKFQSDSNQDFPQSFSGFIGFCKPKKKTEHLWNFHCFPLPGQLAVELGFEDYRALKDILRFLGYLTGTIEIPKTAASRCEKAVKKFESYPEFKELEELDALRKLDHEMRAIEIAYVLYCYDRLEIYVKLKKLLTNEQVLRFAHSIANPDTTREEIQSALAAVQKLFERVGSNAFTV